MMRAWMLGVLLASGCIDGTGAEGPLEAMCDSVFLCYDFLDSGECQDQWFATNDPASACDNEAAYLNCMDTCIGFDCGTQLDTCELDCWADHCGKVFR